MANSAPIEIHGVEIHRAEIQSHEIPLERLEADLAGLAASIAAATCQWLLTLAEYDRRRGWETWECKSCAHWLTWKCAMAIRTAREHVRVARALEDLPLVTTAFAQGQLSYCKVRALSRVANEDNEAELVTLAVAMTGIQLERTVAGLARTAREGERDEEQEAADAVASRRVGVSDNHDGTHTITLVVPAEDASLVLEAIDRRLNEIIDDAAGEDQSRREVIEHRGGRSALRADAAVELLTTAADRDPETRPRPFDVTVVIEPEPENGSAEPSDTTGAREQSRIGSRRLAPTTALRLCCDAIVGAAVKRDELAGIGADRVDPVALIDVGRRQRTLPRRLRRALEQRDQHCCQFPGCDASQRLHAHHITWWRDGGRTDLDNLVLVCHFHHRVMHEGRWTVRHNRLSGEIEFFDPSGTLASGHQLPPAPFTLAEPAGHHLGSRWVGEPLDYSLITSTCVHNEEVSRRERLAPSARLAP